MDRDENYGSWFAATKLPLFHFHIKELENNFGPYLKK